MFKSKSILLTRSIFLSGIIACCAINFQSCKKENSLIGEPDGVAVSSTVTEKNSLLAEPFGAAVSSTVTVNVTGNGGPDVNYKRGVAAPGQNGFFDTQQSRDYLDYVSSEGADIFNGIRNLYKDPQTTEFYNESGVFKNRQIAAFTDIRKYANGKGVEMISQVGGTPTNSGYSLATNYILEGGDYAPLPSTGTSMTEFQKNFSAWAIAADKAVGTNYHSIWIGTQEIAHTLGYIDGIQTTDTKKLNIRRYIEYWKPIAANLRNASAKVGGIQLNSSNSDLYQYAVDYLILKDVKLDYLTFQFYQWGDVVDLDNAVAALDSYNKTYPGTKIIIDRGMFTKIGGNSNSVIDLLIGEKKAMDYANKIYAWTLDQAMNGLDINKVTPGYITRAWLYKTPIKRRPLTGLPSGVSGFALTSTDSKKMNVALWNTSASEYTISVKLSNSTITSSAIPTVKKVTASAVSNVSATWNNSTKMISALNIKTDEILLVTLQ